MQTLKNSDSPPHFIGIGAHKGGTTWLHENLKCHPDIWMPPKKELHYFDRSPRYATPSQLACSRPLIKRLISSEIGDVRFREHLIRAIYSFSKSPSMSDFDWYVKYFLGDHDNKWYLSLFDSSSCSVRGEITPSYSMMDESDVAKAHQLIPNAKIIMLIRYPIDRAWSAIRYRQKRKYKNRALTSLPVEELKEIINSENFDRRSDYLRTLELWKKYFSEDQVFVGFYDDIKENPTDLLLQIFSFLNVEESVKNISLNVEKRVNASPPKAIPQQLEYELAKKYHSQIRSLSELLGHHATSWLERTERILNYDKSLCS